MALFSLLNLIATSTDPDSFDLMSPMWQMCHVNVRILHLSIPHTEPLGCIDEEQADSQIKKGLAEVHHLLTLEVDCQVSHSKICTLQL